MGCFCSKSKFVEEDLPAPRPRPLTPTPVSILKKPAPAQRKTLERGDLQNQLALGAGTRKPRDPVYFKAVRTALNLSSETEENAAYHRAIRHHYDISSESVTPDIYIPPRVVYSPSVYSQPSNPSHTSLKRTYPKYVLPSDF